MGANIVTNSYSSATDEPGSYTLTTSDIDSYTYQNQDMLVLFSASNNGPSYGSISSFSVNKNGLSVGSVEKALTFSCKFLSIFWSLFKTKKKKKKQI